ncbi:MAG: excinuclease ABC subunit C, partial [Candidatus Neomarinimicrobiota bacterium]|nr:excinuclease ABC subunit C [Candidatus Neomarinimicrobiota bacterium]
KYNIKSLDGVDDFASIREVVFRRYKRVKEEGTGLPDLIVVDGGKGQLSMAVSALRELGLDYVPIISLAKKLEEVFMPGHADPQSIHKQSPGLILLRQLRDEAHRFAITFQRQKRNKSVSKSVFINIKGIGEKKVQKLLSKYKDLEVVASKLDQELAKELSISKAAAKEVIETAKRIIS